MKKFILLIMLTALVSLGLSNTAKAAYEVPEERQTITRYEYSQTGDITIGEFYAIRYYFWDTDQIGELMGVDDDGMITRAIVKTNVDEVLAEINWVASRGVKEIFNDTDVADDLYDCHRFFIVKAIRDAQNLYEDDLYSKIYHLTVEPAPIIETDDYHLINYDQLLSLDEIKARYKATDNHDKEISSKIQFTTNYPARIEDVKLGEYYITAAVSDTSGNETTLTNRIIVEDTTAPVFDGEFSHILEYETPFTEKNILSKLTCVDNYEGKINQSNFRIQDDKKIDPESLENQVFHVYYTDGSGNVGGCDVTVKFIDSVFPVITVSDTITASPEAPLSEAQIINILVNKNQIPGDYKSAKVESEYFNNQDKKGTFASLCTVLDKEGKTIRYRFKINVEGANIVEEPNNNALYIGLSFAIGLVLIGGGTIGYYYYKKRKNLAQVEKN